MLFKLGEKVSFLNEKGGGIIQEIKGTKYLVEDDTGFLRSFFERDLCKINGEPTIGELNITSDIEISKKLLSQKKGTKKSLKKNKDFWEIDLHTHNFIENEKGWSNYELLNYQLDKFKMYMEEARSKRVRKLVVIHGVGKGVLKKAIQDFLEGRLDLKFYDSDFRIYGSGATTIELYYR